MWTITVQANIEDVLFVREGATTPSEHCRSTLEQAAEPAIANTGPCDELAC